MTRRHRRHHLAAWLVLAPTILGMLIGALAIRAHAAAVAASTGAHR